MYTINRAYQHSIRTIHDVYTYIICICSVEFAKTMAPTTSETTRKHLFIASCRLLFTIQPPLIEETLQNSAQIAYAKSLSRSVLGCYLIIRHRVCWKFCADFLRIELRIFAFCRVCRCILSHDTRMYVYVIVDFESFRFLVYSSWKNFMVSDWKKWTYHLM